MLTSAKSHTNSEITKVDNKINSEISRAKTSETNLSDRIDDLEEGLTNALNEVKEYTDSEVKNNTNKINILNGTGEGSIIKTVKDEISNLVGTAPEKLDTLQEIADYLEEHEDMASGLVNSLSELETKKVDKTELNNLKTDTDSALQSLEKTKANTTGNYPSLHVGTADDLAGRGESVPAEFGFRASGGKSIRDGRAFIKSIKGNSVVWNQQCESLLDWEINGALSLSENENEYIYNVLAGAGNPTKLRYRILSGHKYMLSLEAKCSDVSQPTFICFAKADNTPVFSSSNFTEAYAQYCVLIKDVTDIVEAQIRTRNYAQGTTISIKKDSLQLVDLTQMFQSGNEPTTIEEFNARVATLGVDLNAYNEGQVIHCNTESVKSVGDNAWDEQWEVGIYSSTSGKPVDAQCVRNKNKIRIMGNTQYYFHLYPSKAGANGGYAMFYDKDDVFLSYQPVGGGYVPYQTITTPANAYYMNFYVDGSYGTTYNHDICIRLAHTGYKTDYEPYWQDILPLPIIRKYFPDGMKSTGSAHDEIRYNKASGKREYSKGRIKSVDLGTLEWETQSINGVNYFRSQRNNLNAVIADNRTNNERYILCAKYQALNRSEGNTQYYSQEDKVILLNHGYFGNINTSKDLITIRDSSYTDAATFKADMSGVMLYYEAADWEWVELDAEDQNFRDYYNVADFGTEEAIPATDAEGNIIPSAPFSADIIYQFNAVDMIREHEIEIADIKTSKQDFISDLSTIRSNAAKGATALQNVPSEYVKRSELTALQNEINALRAMIEEITIQE